MDAHTTQLTCVPGTISPGEKDTNACAHDSHDLKRESSCPICKKVVFLDSSVTQCVQCATTRECSWSELRIFRSTHEVVLLYVTGCYAVLFCPNCKTASLSPHSLLELAESNPAIVRVMRIDGKNYFFVRMPARLARGAPVQILQSRWPESCKASLARLPPGSQQCARLPSFASQRQPPNAGRWTRAAITHGA